MTSGAALGSFSFGDSLEARATSRCRTPSRPAVRLTIAFRENVSIDEDNRDGHENDHRKEVPQASELLVDDTLEFSHPWIVDTIYTAFVLSIVRVLRRRCRRRRRADSLSRKQRHTDKQISNETKARTRSHSRASLRRQRA